jgi:hypothetical protein
MPTPGSYWNNLAKSEKQKIEIEIQNKEKMAETRLKRGTYRYNAPAIPNPTPAQITEEAGTQQLQDLLKTN